MNRPYEFSHIADIHFGAVSADKLYFELKEKYIEVIKKKEFLDCIFIAGDLFHRRIDVNSPHFKSFVLFLNDLFDVAKEKKAKVRIIKGTDSHDYNQLDYIRPMVSKYNVDCRLITTVEKEDLFEDVKVLYIPEECITNAKEYYQPYFEDTYDVIVAHGLITETCFSAKTQESEITMSKAPILDSKVLMSICKGPILMGHIHSAMVIKDKIYYSGSFTRWKHGEENPKGFNHVVYNPETGEYLVQFIENDYAKKYNTMVVDVKNDKDDVTTIVDNVSKLIEMVSNDNTEIKVKFNIPDSYDKPELLTKTLNEFFSKKEGISIEILNNSKLKKKEEMDKKIELILDKYDVVFQKGATPEEKVHHFIKVKFGKNIPIEKIKNYFYNPITIGSEE